MNARRLEEIFEECVTAYLDGRRSIEQSLSLYPTYAAELAPLLQTAIQLNDSFQRVQPPEYVVERGRQRFLADARARRQVRTLTAAPRAGFFERIFQQNGMRMAAGAAVVAVLVAVGTTAALTGGSSGGDNVTQQFPTPAATERPTPASVLSINQAINNITVKQQAGQPVQPEDITKLAQATTELSSASRPEIEDAKEQVAQALTNADSVLTTIVATQPEVAPQAQQAKDTVRGVAGGLDIEIPSTTPALTATPGPSTEPTATPVPTQATVTETPAPTDAPTPEPTAEPETPSPTPVERGLPGGDLS